MEGVLLARFFMLAVYLTATPCGHLSDYVTINKVWDVRPYCLPERLLSFYYTFPISNMGLLLFSQCLVYFNVPSYTTCPLSSVFVSYYFRSAISSVVSRFLLCTFPMSSVCWCFCLLFLYLLFLFSHASHCLLLPFPFVFQMSSVCWVSFLLDYF